jgi:hypothetical protein
MSMKAGEAGWPADTICQWGQASFNHREMMRDTKMTAIRGSDVGTAPRALKSANTEISHQFSLSRQSGSAIPRGPMRRSGALSF